jgi:methylated-DNA-[protein]-cysteine S-methyltransferase
MPELIFNSPIGLLTLVETDSAITSLEWRKSRLNQETTTLLLAKKELAQYFGGELTKFTAPLDPSGTAFQIRVWKTIMGIPYGEQWTYSDIANILNSSPRAVGGACGRNPIPVIIPCHRVVGSNGDLTGYTAADGIKTKSFLLEHEEHKTRLLGL